MENSHIVRGKGKPRKTIIEIIKKLFSHLLCITLEMYNDMFPFVLNLSIDMNKLQDKVLWVS